MGICLYYNNKYKNTSPRSEKEMTATATTTTVLTEYNATDVAAALNEAHAKATVKVNGILAVSRWAGKVPFHSYLNGTLSVDTPAKAKDKFRTDFFKVGTELVIEIEEN